jgi:hypothetical protein
VTEDPTFEGDFERTLRIAHSKQAVPEAMRFAELAVSSCDAACREAIVLAASELAENIVKYGVQHPDPRAGTVTVGVHGKVARIRATNAVASTDDARHVVAMVARMSEASSNVAALYRARLRELFANPGAPRAQLGLLRLAFEGSFRLSASFEAPLLQIVAERPCKSD